MLSALRSIFQCASVITTSTTALIEQGLDGAMDEVLSLRDQRQAEIIEQAEKLEKDHPDFRAKYAKWRQAHGR